jgi:hypothetical protein
VTGFGTLENLADLLAKLRHDFSRVTDDPADSFAAFDFFVTAEHMLDWAHPGYANRQPRESLRRDHVLLQVVSHIASGSKHFVAEARQHESVQHADTVGGSYDPEVRPPGVAVGTLYVTLDGPAASVLGAHVGVVELASEVLRFWETYVEEHDNV